MNALQTIHLVECPRDAIQGWPHSISTADKLAYYRLLLRVGFQTLDLGSFVSHKAIPSMADTAAVIQQLSDEGQWQASKTRGLVIVANERGVREAVEFDAVTDVGFPLSLSPIFQERNTKANMDEAWNRLDAIANWCEKRSKNLVVYLSMGFGNPYGDPWDIDLPCHWSERLIERVSPSVISFADTIGSASPAGVEEVFRRVTTTIPCEKVGAHLHLHPMDGLNKIEAAFRGGCRRFDGALRGVGGCPMAQDDLVGNAPTELLVEWAEKLGMWSTQDSSAWEQAQSMAADLFA